MKQLTVLRPGPLCLVQDRGRPGYASIGVGRSGAADLDAHNAANRLVGNAFGAATLEVTFGGLKVTAEYDAIVAVTGAQVTCTVDGTPHGGYSTLMLRAGSTLTMGTPTSGLRSYVAVRGGVDAPATLGSRSTDRLSGLGPDAVQPGDVLSIGNESAEWPAADYIPPPHTRHTLRIRFGPRNDWFTDDAEAVLLQQLWTVTADSDRIGVSLDGEQPLLRAVTDELASEGMVTGALQVPPSGKPVLFLADHPVTGGYPVIAVVHTADIPVAAQLTPGSTLRFRATR